jgi:hypothetical protein
MITAVWCQPDLARSVTRALGANTVVRTEWTEFLLAARMARCLVVAAEQLTADVRVLDDFASLLRSQSLVPVIIIGALTDQDASALGRVQFDRFISLDRVDVDLGRTAAELIAVGPRPRIAAALASAARLDVVREVGFLLFGSDAIPHDDAELARLACCKLNRLRYACRSDLGLTPASLRRWARLILALEIWERGIRHPEVEIVLGVDSSTLRRDAVRLLATGFTQAARQGSMRIGQRFVTLIQARMETPGDFPPPR